MSYQSKDQEIKELKKHLAEKNRSLNEYQMQVGFLERQMVTIQDSICWKLTKPIRIVGSTISKIVGKMISAFKFLIGCIPQSIFWLKNFGLKEGVRLILQAIKKNLLFWRNKSVTKLEVSKEEYWTEFNTWLEEANYEFVDILSIPMGWDTQLFQRFQHISLQSGNVGGISIYGAHPSIDKDVEMYKIISPTLCIVNLDNPKVKSKLFSILEQIDVLKYIRIQSIDLATKTAEIRNYLHSGFEIVYEYIDEITTEITGKIPEFVHERHEYLLKDEKITVIATSNKLYEQATKYRTRNIHMISNGVDYDYWHIKKEDIEIPEDIVSIVNSGKVIIGYHGALAKWIDYNLLKNIVKDKKYCLLLIGVIHDSALKDSGLLECDNVYYIGAKPYLELRNYAAFYDIAILPFQLNNITLSVSPVKIFEYMALLKPVVTYALPECKKYPSCLIAHDSNEFMEKLELALTLREDASYLKLLDQDALDNTWLTITKKFVEKVKENKANRVVVSNKKEEIGLNNDLSTSEMENYLEQVLSIPSCTKSEYFKERTNDPYVRKEGDAKVIAYYLTQFHPDPHNEEWWGRGVTEWNNVVRAMPQYVGHDQPRFPSDLGYYDLRITDNIKKQVEIAKLYGIYGFSFYYYWFNGERLLERPLEDFLKNKEIDFPFSLCWANENWTKRFDGTNSDILMEQPNTVESYKAVIMDMIRFLKDDRYIEVDGKKLITIYRPSLMPKVKEVINYWREVCLEQGIGELYIVAVKENMVEIEWLKYGFDALSEFHPGTLYTNCNKINDKIRTLRSDFAGEIFDYKDIVVNQKYFNYSYDKLYRAVMPMWDNTARRNNKGMIFEGSTPNLYEEWLGDVIREQNKRQDIEDNLVFINAWNEWGEGTYLEPDKKYGYAYLDATRKAIELNRTQD